jgi:hypothetical protein
MSVCAAAATAAAAAAVTGWRPKVGAYRLLLEVPDEPIAFVEVYQTSFIN